MSEMKTKGRHSSEPIMPLNLHSQILAQFTFTTYHTDFFNYANTGCISRQLYYFKHCLLWFIPRSFHRIKVSFHLPNAISHCTL